MSFVLDISCQQLWKTHLLNLYIGIGHPIIDICLPIVGRIYPIPEYFCQLLAEYQNISNTNIHIYSTVHIFPNCWQYISNKNI